MPNETYRCENCGVTFEKGWTDEEADEERRVNWPDFTPEECSIVCHDCYKKFMEWYNANRPS